MGFKLGLLLRFFLLYTCSVYQVFAILSATDSSTAIVLSNDCLYAYVNILSNDHLYMSLSTSLSVLLISCFWMAKSAQSVAYMPNTPGGSSGNK
jgi:hypothetical protein